MYDHMVLFVFVIGLFEFICASSKHFATVNKNHTNFIKHHLRGRNLRSDSDYTHAYIHRNNARKQHSESTHILLIGDSVDRHMLWDWCERNRVTDTSLNRPIFPTQTWLTFPYHYSGDGDSWELGFRCVDLRTGDSISTAHVYGSNNTGPYFREVSNIKNTTYYIDTEARVPFILDHYVKQFGIPHKVFIHTSQWDKKHFYYDLPTKKILNTSSDQAAVWKVELDLFESNMNHRIDQIQQFFDAMPSHFRSTTTHSCEIGLRTAVWNNDEGEKYLLHAMNNVTVAIARKRKLLLFDYDDDVWSVFGNEKYDTVKHNIYLDNIHPRARFSVAAADKIMGHRYCNALYDFAEFSSDSEAFVQIELQHILRWMTVFLVQTSKDLYLIQRLPSDPRSYGRWSLHGFSAGSMINMFLMGPSDVFPMNDDDALKRLTIDQGALPDQFKSSSSYLMVDLAVPNKKDAIHALLFDGYYVIAFNKAIWDTWGRATSSSAKISGPLPAYWTQYYSSLFTYRGTLDALPGKNIPDKMYH